MIKSPLSIAFVLLILFSLFNLISCLYQNIEGKLELKATDEQGVLKTKTLKRECPLRPSHIKNNYVAHAEKSKFFIFFKEIAFGKPRNVV